MLPFCLFRKIVDTLPGSVIGNTPEFGSGFPGSSPGWADIIINSVKTL